MPNKDKPSNKRIKVSIRNRKKVLYDGSVFSLSSFNDLGEFSVLPQHANFVSLVKKSVTLNKGTSEEKVFELERGLINVDEDGVQIYVGI